MKQPSIIKELGYTWVLNPKKNILPFTLLEKVPEGFFKRIFSKEVSVEAMPDDIFRLFPKAKGRGANPKMEKPQPIAAFKGHDILDAKQVTGIKSAKALSGVVDISGNSQLKKTGKLLYTFKAPQLVELNSIFLLEEHLNIQAPNSDSLKEKCRKGQLFVVTHVLQTKEFSVKQLDDWTIDSDISLDVLQEQLGKLAASLTIDKSTKEHQTYKEDECVTFAIKARQIEWKSNDIYSLSQVELRDVRSTGDFEDSFLEDGLIVLD